MKITGIRTTGVKGFLVVGAAALSLTGCSCMVEEEIVVITESVSEPVEIMPLAPSINSEGAITIYAVGDDQGTGLEGVFYFDFDQAIVKRTGHLEMDKHAEVLKNNLDYSVRLEGHADERGTREYNLALGERRAMAIRSYLVNQGVSGRQLETVSYGEEKPAVHGSSEGDRALNRRVVFKYSKLQ